MARLETRLARLEAAADSGAATIAAAVEALVVHMGLPPGGCPALAALHRSRAPVVDHDGAAGLLPDDEERAAYEDSPRVDAAELDLCRGCDHQCDYGLTTLSAAAYGSAAATQASQAKQEPQGAAPPPGSDPESPGEGADALRGHLGGLLR